MVVAARRLGDLVAPQMGTRNRLPGQILAAAVQVQVRRGATRRPTVQEERAATAFPPVLPGLQSLAAVAEVVVRRQRVLLAVRAVAETALPMQHTPGLRAAQTWEVAEAVSGLLPPLVREVKAS